MERRGQFEPFVLPKPIAFVLEGQVIDPQQFEAIKPQTEEYINIESEFEKRYIFSRAIQEATGTPATPEDIDKASKLIHGAFLDGTEFKFYSGEDLEKFILNILGKRRFVVLSADFPNGTALIESHPPRIDYSDFHSKEY